MTKCKNCGHKLHKDETGKWFHNTSDLTYCQKCRKCGCISPETK